MLFDGFFDNLGMMRKVKTKKGKDSIWVSNNCGSHVKSYLLIAAMRMLLSI